MVQSERYLIFIDKYIFIGKYKGKKNMFCVFTQAQEYDEDAKLWFKLGTIYLNNDKILSIKNVKGLKEYKKIIIRYYNSDIFYCERRDELSSMREKEELLKNN